MCQCCYSANIGDQIIVMSVSVCVFVRDYIFLNTHSIFINFFYASYLWPWPFGRGSVLLWLRNDMLRISGFMDDVIFAIS